MEIVTSKRHVLEYMTQELLAKEVMNADELNEIMNRFKTGPELKPGTSVSKRTEEEKADDDGNDSTLKQGTND